MMNAEVKAAADKMIRAVRLAYEFAPGSYTASALSEACAFRELLDQPNQPTLANRVNGAGKLAKDGEPL